MRRRRIEEADARRDQTDPAKPVQSGTDIADRFGRKLVETGQIQI